MPSDGKARILVVVPKLTVGGTERQLLAVLPRLDRTAFVVSVLATRGPGSLDAEMRAAGIPVFAGPRLLPGRANAALGFLRLLWHLATRRVDVVHCFLPEAYLLGGVAALLVSRAKRVMSRRSLNLYQSRRPVLSLLEQWLHRRTAAVLGNSRAVVAELSAEGVPARRLGLIYNGIDVARFAAADRDQQRARLDLPADALVLSIVATLLPYKSHALLLEALALAKTELPATWRLLLAGRDEGIGAALHAQAEALGIASHLRWLGESRDVAGLLRASDIALLCSAQEGFPNALLEAMAAGLPTIATAVGGVPEIVEDQITGRLVPPGDPRALAEAIVALAEDPAARQRMGAAGRARARARFSLEACVARYERLYRALLSGDPRPLDTILGDTAVPAS